MCKLCYDDAKYGHNGLEITANSVQAERGYLWINGEKVYCCYGMYAEVGHSADCKHHKSATPVDSVEAKS